MLLVPLPATAACAGSEEESDRYKLVVFPVSWGWNLCILDLSNGSTINMNRTRKESRIESARFSRLHSVIRIPSFRRVRVSFSHLVILLTRSTVFRMN